MSDASPFLLTDPDFSKMDVVKAYVHTIVAPAIDYWIKTIDVKKGDEVARFKAARIFNSLHVMVNKISVADIDNLNLFRLSEHPQIGTHSGHEVRDQHVPCSCAVHQVSRREKRCKGERHIFVA